MTEVHELKSQKKNVYCHGFEEFVLDNPNVLDGFYLPGYVNIQNMQIWAAENPHKFHKATFHQKKNWCLLCDITAMQSLPHLF